MIERKAVYFGKAGARNTEATLALVKERVELLRTRHVVVASSTGNTALQLAKLLDGRVQSIVHVALPSTRPGERAHKYLLVPETVEAERALGVVILTATSPIMANVESAITERFGGIGPAELISHVFYCFSQGIKVGVEIALMATDAGLIPPDEEIITVAGTDRGADTAMVLRSTYSREFFKLRIREIICKPR